MKNGLIKIGTCGFRRSKEEYVKKLSTVEIQHTFYQPPQVSTLEKWRDAMSADFEFTLKAWQLITHEGTSPTYKRLRKPLDEKLLKEAGFFRNSAAVKEAWERTRTSAQALKARIVLFQCPAKFEPTRTNIARMTKFFSSIDRASLNFAWEPRGPAWTDAIVKKLCSDLDLWHTVDPFSRNTVTPEQCYFRLHGRVRWRYKYEESELEELATLLPPDKLSYVFFNNITMTDDAMHFAKIVRLER